MTSLNQGSNIEVVINHAYMTLKELWNHPYSRLGRAATMVELMAIFMAVVIYKLI